MSEKTPYSLEDKNDKNIQGSLVKTSLNPEELRDIDRRLRKEDENRQTASKPNNSKKILAVGWADREGVHIKDKAA